MTKEHIKNLIIRRYLDEVKGEMSESDNIEEALYFSKHNLEDKSNTVIFYYSEVYEEAYNLNFKEIIRPIEEKLSKQPNLEKLEYIIDAIDFSLNFTNED